MSEHQAVFTAEKALPTAEAAPGLELPRELPITVPQVPTVVADVPNTSRKRLLRNLLLAGAAVAVLAGAADFGWQYWTVGRFEVSTDDAYVKADNTTIAPRISGYIAAVLVDDNQPVTAGQVLARIDDRDFKVNLEQARAEVGAAKANIANKQAAIVAQQSAIEAAQATVALDRANATFAEQDDQRYAELAKKGYGSVQNAQEAASKIAAARAAVTRDTAVIGTAAKQLDVIKAELAQAQAALSRAQAAEAQAELNLSYTALVSPVDGVIGNRTLRIGQYVQTGSQLMSVVPNQTPYIIANYKETQLANVQRGEPVDIKVDSFPGQVFKGHVDSLSPTSGQEFALLPPDNATGNFTKVVQRIPVKIVLDRTSPLSVVLRPGMSVYPTIDTKAVATQVASASESIH
ncbi:MAG: HlyD family efflux transporter periplasmic adaptor subunit [Mesorhizobium sp.]|uniref:HlyD family secretion protein n=1 Tax=unclassified Mesorhizobium TaxID=325217 RepID=UPI000F758FB1|nr:MULTISPECIES: HlyD family secretion protein [unclassified Mesorhizobium]RVC78097.1 HlyD family efflux transporter periplasmic adaptor subunit [Mesorhizobium sp. M2A.F.Ca.ET.046.02.1.1]AZO36421.1 HlyD family secretion protein [Mesorhizobium sp. M2A.F.Ca.ET.046.03.2.1]RWB44995.1 MAG: HlyD family efflux transporter periplasmic adaptor subunit [Mesorhizobium sp.]RWE21506.1 MAG: HlyD family efflux transporter periplasmic adaptor subunit [Mesorhizobium sp.]RWF05327.1 MAG: HlyD family efflux trans